MGASVICGGAASLNVASLLFGRSRPAADALAHMPEIHSLGAEEVIFAAKHTVKICNAIIGRQTLFVSNWTCACCVLPPFCVVSSNAHLIFHCAVSKCVCGCVCLCVCVSHGVFLAHVYSSIIAAGISSKVWDTAVDMSQV